MAGVSGAVQSERPRRGRRPSVPEYDRAYLASIFGQVRSQHETSQDMVADTLRRAILDGHLRPGAKLLQDDLATLFDTSRIPIREALSVLEVEGLVTAQPRRGYAVTGLDADEIAEIYELRLVLEAEATRYAVPLLTELDQEDIRRINAELRAAPDPTMQLAIRERLYLRFYEVSNRPRMVEIIQRLRQEIWRSMNCKVVHHSPAHHERFFAAVLAGDADRAVAELQTHYPKVSAFLRRSLRD